MTEIGEKSFSRRREALKFYWPLVLVMTLACASAGAWMGSHILKPVYSGKIILLFWNEDKNIDPADKRPADKPSAAKTLQNSIRMQLASHNADSSELFARALQSTVIANDMLERVLTSCRDPELIGCSCLSKMAVYPLDDARLAVISLTGNSRNSLRNCMELLFEDVEKRVQQVDKLQVASLSASKPEIYLIAGYPYIGSIGGFLFWLIVGFFGSWLLAIMFLPLRHSLKDLQWLEKKFHLPIIGVLPETAKPFTAAKGMTGSREYRTAINSLYVGVKCCRRNKKRANVCMMTSIGRGDGKSVTIASLAAAAGQLHDRVLIIDINWRNPQQHKIFNLGKVEGLREFMSGKCEFSAVLRRNILANVDLLPCGLKYTPRSMKENFRKLESILQAQAENYDLILLDVPDVFDVNDPLIVGQAADCTLLLCDSRKKSISTLDVVLWRMNTAGLHINGLVLNLFPAENQSDVAQKYQYSLKKFF